MSLALGRAWAETAALVRRRWRLLFPVAFLCLALPGAVLRALAPVTPAGRLPDGGWWLLAAPVLVLLALAGALAIARLALDLDARGMAARLPALLGATLLILFAGTVSALPLFVLGFFLGEAAGRWLVLLWLVASLCLWARLALLTPAAAAERLGPVALLQRSWALTRGHFWVLFGLLVLILIVSLAVLLATGAFALALGRPEPGTLALLLGLLLSALLQALVGGLVAAFFARLYAQCAAVGAAGQTDASAAI